MIEQPKKKELTEVQKVTIAEIKRQEKYTLTF
jgi:hypothetical protein